MMITSPPYSIVSSCTLSFSYHFFPTWPLVFRSHFSQQICIVLTHPSCSKNSFHHFYSVRHLRCISNKKSRIPFWTCIVLNQPCRCHEFQWGRDLAYLEALRTYSLSFHGPLNVKNDRQMLQLGSLIWIPDKRPWKFHYLLNEIALLLSSIQVSFHQILHYTNNIVVSLAKQAVPRVNICYLLVFWCNFLFFLLGVVCLLWHNSLIPDSFLICRNVFVCLFNIKLWCYWPQNK